MTNDSDFEEKISFLNFLIKNKIQLFSIQISYFNAKMAKAFGELVLKVRSLAIKKELFLQYPQTNAKCYRFCQLM